MFKKKRQAGGAVNAWEAPGEVPKKKWVKMACKYFFAVYGLRGRQKTLLEEAALTASQPASFKSIMGRLGEFMEARSGSYIEDASIVLEALSKCSGSAAAPAAGIPPVPCRSSAYRTAAPAGFSLTAALLPTWSTMTRTLRGSCC